MKKILSTVLIAGLLGVSGSANFPACGAVSPDRVCIVRPSGQYEAPQAKAAGKAVITLDIQQDYGDGSGYQILLDADHDTYGVQIPSTVGVHMSEFGDVDPSVYAEFEYKMPENASGSVSDGSWLVGIQRQSMEIEPGVYDYVVCSPLPDNKVLIVWYGEDGVGDDVEFKAGIEYVFTITQWSGWSDGCVMTEICPLDLALEEVLSPGTGVDLDGSEVKVRIANTGSQDVESFRLYYSVNGKDTVSETVDRLLSVGEEMEYTFASRFAAPIYGEYTLEAWVEAAQDGNAGNDRKVHTITNQCDLTLESLVSPESGPELNVRDVVVQVRNNGKFPVSFCQYAYELDWGVPVVESDDAVIEAGQAHTYTFKKPVNFYAYAEYNFKVWIASPFDTGGNSDTVEMKITNSFREPHEPLFWDDFNQADSGLHRWSVIDANGDGRSWMFELDEDENGWIWSMTGHASSRASMQEASDDYLVTKEAVPMDAGKHYVRFNYNAISPYYQEHLRLLYGTSPDPENMTVLWEKDGFAKSADAPYYTEILNLDIPEEGAYYFAFHSCSEKGQIGIRLDNVIVDTGWNQSSYNLAVEKVLLPLSGCGLGQESVGVRLSNSGADHVYEYRLSYSVNGGEPVEQLFTDTVLAGNHLDVWFDEPVDMSVAQSYAIRVEGTVIPHSGQQQETYLRDNEVSAGITHQTPVSLPFVSDFRNPEDRTNWNFRDSAWKYQTNMDFLIDSSWINTICADEEEPLVSRCMEFEEGTWYRISYEYVCGLSTGIGLVPESFEIRCGLAGTPVQEWDVLRSYKDYYTMDQARRDDASFLCPLSGEYSVAIVPVTAYTTIVFRSVVVDEAPENDLRVVGFQFDAPVMLPVSHAGQDFHADYGIVNKGWADVPEADLCVRVGGEEVHAEEIAVGSIEDSVSGRIGIRLPEMEAGETTWVSLSVYAGTADADSSDNEREELLIVTDSVMAYDEVTEGMYTYWNAVGAASGNEIVCGIPFTLGLADTLTSISVGWAEIMEPMEIGYQIWHWDAEAGVLGDLIFEGSCMRDLRAGQHVYPVLPMLLQPGSYLITVRMSGRYLVADRNFGAPVYLVQGRTAYRQENLGCPAIRAHFGHGAEVYAKDVSADGFTLPSSTGTFSSEELVVVKVTNRGVSQEIIPVKVRVNGELLEPAQVRLNAYTAGEVLFTADLSRMNAVYDIEAWVDLEGDENSSNDTCRMTVRTGSLVDPYRLDFESCSDFSIKFLNPLWTMVDGDGHYPYGLDGFGFPYSGMPFAFIVFNPDATSPAMDPSPAIEPFGGQRFGASFSSPDGRNDDWLISPKLRLPAEDAKIALEVKSYSSEYGLEEYNILVSSQGNEPSDFVRLGGTRTAPADRWEHVEVDLDDYAGKEVYLAIQCVSDNRFMFMVDDIEVSRPVSSESVDLASSLYLYPNPAVDEIHILSTADKIEELTVFDAKGIVVSHRSGLGRSQVEQEVEDWEAGMYFARVRTASGVCVLKFLVR